MRNEEGPGADAGAGLSGAHQAVSKPGVAIATGEDMKDPNDVDLQQYGESLGVDVRMDSDLLWVVQEAFNAPLPASWTEHTDEEGRVYFFHEVSSQSTWEHPMDAVYRELLNLVRQIRGEPAKDQRAAWIHEHLRTVHQRALQALDSWSGPYVSQEGDYYFNDALKASSWECPVTAWEQELMLRHTVLCRCLLPQDLVVGADGTVAADPTNEFAAAAGPDFLQALRLPLGLVRPESGDVPEEPSTTRSFATARSMCSSRSQPRTSARSPCASPGRSPMDQSLGRSPEGSGSAVSGPVSPAVTGSSTVEVQRGSQACDDDDSDDEPLGFTFGNSNPAAAAQIAGAFPPNVSR